MIPKDIVSSRHPNLPQSVKDFINKILWEIPKGEEHNTIADANTWSQMYREAIVDVLESNTSTIVWADLPAWDDIKLTKESLSGPDGEITSLLVGFYRFVDTAPEHSFGDSWPLIWLYWDGTDFITFYEGADVGDDHKESDVWLEEGYNKAHREFIKQKEQDVLGWFRLVESGGVLGLKDSSQWEGDILKKDKVAIIAVLEDDGLRIKNPILNWLWTPIESLYD